MIAAEPLRGRFTANAERPSATLLRDPAETLEAKQARIEARAETHFEKQRERWVNTRYQALLKKDGPAPHLTPGGIVEDRSARLMRAANHLAAGKHHARLAMIRNAGERMRGLNVKGLER